MPTWYRETDTNLAEYDSIIHEDIPAVMPDNTLGDAHSNLLLLLAFGIRSGILDIAKENYSRIVELYQQCADDFTHKAYSLALAQLEIKFKDDPEVIAIIRRKLKYRDPVDPYFHAFLGECPPHESINEDARIRVNNEINKLRQERAARIRSDLDELKTLIGQIRPKPGLSEHQITRFLGDLLADRGVSDYFILLLLAQMDVCGLTPLILLSNHDMDLISVFESVLNNAEAEFDPSMLQEKAGLTTIGLNQNRSLQTLVYAVQERYIPKDEVLDLYDFYKSKLRLLDYTVSNSPDEPRIRIYMHGSCSARDLIFIRELAKKFQIDYAADNSSQLMATIDLINEAFEESVRRRKVASLMTTKHYLWGNNRDILNKSLIPEENNSVEHLIWARSGAKEMTVLPDGTRIEFCYGHNQEDKKEHTFPLDGGLGKARVNAITSCIESHSLKGVLLTLSSDDRHYLSEEERQAFADHPRAVRKETPSLATPVLTQDSDDSHHPLSVAPLNRLFKAPAATASAGAAAVDHNETLGSSRPN